MNLQAEASAKHQRAATAKAVAVSSTSACTTKYTVCGIIAVLSDKTDFYPPSYHRAQIVQKPIAGRTLK